MKDGGKYEGEQIQIHRLEMKTGSVGIEPTTTDHYWQPQAERRYIYRWTLTDKCE